MKIVKIAVGCVIVILLFALAINSYLRVDDLSGCETSPSSKKGCEAADAIVALSGGDTLARADEAIRLYKNGWAKTLIFSGAAADKSGPSNAKVMEQRAVAAGVDANNVIIEQESETTQENASETAAIFERERISSAIIVTSAYHQRRAMLEFNKSTKDVTLRAHSVAQDNQWGPLWWLTPTGWMLALPEVVHSLILSVGGVDRT